MSSRYDNFRDSQAWKRCDTADLEVCATLPKTNFRFQSGDSVKSIVKTSAIVFFLLLFSALHCRSEILLDDSFDYADGALITVSGGKWAHHSGTSGEMTVASDRVNLNESDSEDVNALLAGGPYSAGGTTNVFYAGFTVHFTELPSSGGTYFAHFKDDSASGFRGKVWAFTSGAAPGAFRLGISASSSSSKATDATDLALNVDYKIVLRFVNSNSLATLWIAPENENSPSVSSVDAASDFTVAAFAFRQSGGEGVLQIDDLKVATTFAEVISLNFTFAPYIITPPESQTVTEGGTATFSVLAGGTEPLFYQWQFNGTNLSGATSDSLLLTNVSSANAGNYRVIISNSVDSVTSGDATLTVNPPPAAPALTILTYNTKGNGADDWSTNAPQVQAIARIVKYLNPDIITFQEIPFNLSYEMTNFVKAFLPGYSLARNSGTDGFIRSAIVSRFPISRSTSWLDGANLNPWGYTNTSSGSADNFTRDLFEAQINVPGFARPLHVFTAHLKSSSGGYTESAAKRAAESAAITNFFATNLFVLYPNDPYYLAGDMNEANTNTVAIQRLISAPAGLRLTNPANPFTDSINTFSIQGSLSSRIDYIFPGGILFSNIVSSEVFRTDLFNPVPAGIQSGDSETASDHLPVLMTFANPYDTPFQITSLVLSNQSFTLNWQSSSGRQYRVESSTTLTNWVPLSSLISATGTNASFQMNLDGAQNLLRVRRVQ